MPVTKPVFNDDTGRRAAVLLWVGRAVVAVCLILCVAIGLTLTTHIALPGLDGLVSPTLNESRPDMRVPAEMDRLRASEAPNQSTKLSDPTTTPSEARSASSPARLTSIVAVARRPATSSAPATRRPATSRVPAKPTVKPRSSHAATPGTEGRKVGPKASPTRPDRNKRP
jgi:hypothetical protein